MKRVLPLLVAFAALPAFAGVIDGRVIEVPDGGTITILSREGASIHRVRLAGVEAPGKDKPNWGSSRESLRRLASGKTVRVDTTAIDPKGQLVGVVSIVRGPRDCAGPCAGQVDPGLSQLSAGLATVDKTYLSHHPEEVQKRYSLAEAHARVSRLGLWRAPQGQLRADAPAR
jgi:endonuclease YncB( thermonuclease family)